MAVYCIGSYVLAFKAGGVSSVLAVGEFFSESQWEIAAPM